MGTYQACLRAVAVDLAWMTQPWDLLRKNVQSIMTCLTLERGREEPFDWSVFS